MTQGGSCIRLDESNRHPPLVKWPGGKRALVDVISRFVPESFSTYYEPYFDLIDYRNIALANWTIFQNLLGYGKRNESKDKQTKWMVEVNELRNQIAHASSGVLLRAESLVQLEDYEEWLEKKVTEVDSEDVGENVAVDE